MKLKSIVLTTALFLFSLTIAVSQNTVILKTTSDSLSYSLGVMIGQSVKTQGVTELNTETFAVAIQNVLDSTDLAINMENANIFLQEYFTNLQKQKNAPAIEVGEKFFAENKNKEGIVTLESGLQYKVLTEGTGEKPASTDKVKVHYHGTLLDGKVFDSSVERGEPISFSVNGVIAGWTEALQLMPVGSKWKLFIPYQLAYGERGAGRDIKPYTSLIFEVELLEIEK